MGIEIVQVGGETYARLVMWIIQVIGLLAGLSGS